MMNYYYEYNDGCIDAYNLNGEKIKVQVGKITWNVCEPSGNVIAEATTEESANLIVTLMNGEGNA